MKRPDRRERSTPMTHAERVAEIKGRFGFTERQAGFLVTVMLHAGVCLARQYCAFARIKYGRADANVLPDARGAPDSRRRRPVRTVAPACFTSTTSPSTPPSANPTTGSADR